ncbi:TRAP-type C4-dicarboxylate transport system, small permease component [Ralstonia sp. 25mfcol4.1]|uniref:TRAP transporter small permease n=1 Tax=Burkholderiaceae TaxID=119060 RepID=UPI00088A8BC8|nr:TRAP transporter small permease [Ralstonia sp. 25mfcol4.1]SDO76747.1 TRAP-type C4-dicarboxylate transport system, small permease component [Ralstonia sp. 25mfcol4.1]
MLSPSPTPATPADGAREPAAEAGAARAHVYTRFCAALARACLGLGVFGLLLLVVAVLYQVFGRYVLNDTPTWAESIAMLLVLYVTMLGTAVGVRDAGHIGLESLLILLPDHLRTKLEILIHVLVGVFGAVMAYNCAFLAHSVADYKLPTLGISEGWRYLPPVIAGTLIVLFSIEHIIAVLKGTEVEPAWH